MRHHHVSIDEDQKRVACLLRQKVTDGRTPGVLVSFNQATMRHVVDAPVPTHRLLVRGAVVSHDDLVGRSQLLCLML